MHTINKQKTIQNVILYGLLLIGGVFSVLPMIYMISTSLKPNGALYEYPPHFFPKLSQITLENYVYIFNQEKFYLNFLNSLVVAILTIVFAAIIASALAFLYCTIPLPRKKGSVCLGYRDNDYSRYYSDNYAISTRNLL